MWHTLMSRKSLIWFGVLKVLLPLGGIQWVLDLGWVLLLDASQTSLVGYFPPLIVVQYLSANEHVQFVSKIISTKTNTIIETCACSQNICPNY